MWSHNTSIGDIGRVAKGRRHRGGRLWAKPDDGVTADREQRIGDIAGGLGMAGPATTKKNVRAIGSRLARCTPWSKRAPLSATTHLCVCPCRLPLSRSSSGLQVASMPVRGAWLWAEL